MLFTYLGWLNNEMFASLVAYDAMFFLMWNVWYVVVDDALQVCILQTSLLWFVGLFWYVIMNINACRMHQNQCPVVAEITARLCEGMFNMVGW